MSGLQFQKNLPLQGLNTLALRSTAEYFVELESVQDFQEARQFARDMSLPITVLGGGSNVLLPEYLDGLVIHPVNKGIELLEEQDTRLLVEIQAGENWHQLVMSCVEQGWYGLENLALIPGNAGAAPIQNIGAYGVELKDRFHSLKALHLETGESLQMSNAECLFGYRDSIFKNRLKGRVMITSITLQLTSEPVLQLDYPALSDLRGADVSPRNVADRVIDIRRSKLPDPAVLPNVGSFFKNPVVSVEQAQEIRSMFPDLVSYPVAGGEKLAAGWLIDKAGWRGRKSGDVGVHEQQALVLVNYGNGDKKAITTLAGLISQDIEKRFGVVLEQEPVEI